MDPQEGRGWSSDQPLTLSDWQQEAGHEHTQERKVPGSKETMRWDDFRSSVLGRGLG